MMTKINKNIFIKKKKGTVLNKSVKISFLLNTIMLTCVLLFFSPGEKTDDLLMKQILDGAFGGAPDAHLLYINYLLGGFLKLIKLMIPGAAWLEISQYFVLYVSFVTFVILTWDEKADKKNWLVVLPIVIVFGFDAYVKLTFTKTAGIVVATGFYWNLMNLKKEKRIWSYIAAVVWIVAGSLYRIKILYMMGVLFFFAYVYEALKGREEKTKDLIKKAALYMLVWGTGIGISLSLNIVGSMMFNAYGAWREYKEWNAYKVELQDRGWPDYFEYQEEYEKLEISYNDYTMWVNRDYSDPEHLTTEVFKSICEFKKTPENSIQQFLKMYPLKFYEVKVSIILVLVCGFLCCSSFKDKKLFLLFVFIISMAFEFYFYQGGRYDKYHVDFCLFYGLTLVIVYALYSSALNYSAKMIMPYIEVALLIFILNRDYNYITSSTYEGNQFSMKEEDAREVMDILSEDKDNFYIMSNSELYGLIRSYGVFDTYERGVFSNIFMLNGYMVPSRKRSLDIYGIKNPYESMLYDQNVYYVTSRNFERLDVIAQYLREHYNEYAAYYFVRQEKGAYIYKFYVNSGEL